MTPEQQRILFDAHYIWVKEHIEQHGEPENRGIGRPMTDAEKRDKKDGMYAAYILDMDADEDAEKRYDEILASTGMFPNTPRLTDAAQDTT